MKRIRLDIADIETVKALHVYLRWLLELPETYGGNLDALHDALTEIAEDTLLEVHAAGVRGENAAYLPRLLRVLQDAVQENERLRVSVEPTILATPRLILRPWAQSDAPSLYAYAKDERIGPMCGWAPHTSEENSRAIIRDILSAPGTFAVVPKAAGHAAGSLGIMRAGSGTAPIGETEAEIGYWIGAPFWGQGLIPEAVREGLRYCFEELGCTGVWCGYFEGNEKSRRVQEKCGFRYHHTERDKLWRGMTVTEHLTFISREQWKASGE